ncbi:hypothetical protein VNO77_27199 [Canavalia gladiata]|uniref:Uncharacterized protein n=1 Tax=Canavalia gladiata TaxID=3824 RepID=A0AAN9KXE6_CANGL
MHVENLYRLYGNGDHMFEPSALLPKVTRSVWKSAAQDINPPLNLMLCFQLYALSRSRSVSLLEALADALADENRPHDQIVVGVSNDLKRPHYPQPPPKRRRKIYGIKRIAQMVGRLLATSICCVRIPPGHFAQNIKSVAMFLYNNNEANCNQARA